MHVDPNGDLKLNDTLFVSGGVYKEAKPMGLPGTVVKTAKCRHRDHSSVGAGGVDDFTNIVALLNDGVPGPGNRRRKVLVIASSCSSFALTRISACAAENVPGGGARLTVSFGAPVTQNDRPHPPTTSTA